MMDVMEIMAQDMGLIISLAQANLKFVPTAYNVSGYNAKGDSTTNDVTSIKDACNAAAVAGGNVYFPPGIYRISSNYTPPSNVSLCFSAGAMLLVDSGVTFTINCSIVAGLYQIFSGTGTIAGTPRVPWVFPEWFGTVGDVATDDTAALQKALNFGKKVMFGSNYAVTSLTFNKQDQEIDFNNHYLRGIATVANTDAIIVLNSSFSKFRRIWIDGAFNTNYKCAVHWCSISAGNAAGSNVVYDIFLQNTIVGLQFGSYFTDPSPLDAPQSENYIYNFRSRGVQNPIKCNQPNGFLKIIGGTIDCGKYEWDIVNPGVFVDASSYTFNNKQTELSIVSCEILKTGVTTGYGFGGSGFVMVDCTIEIASQWGQLNGDADLTNCRGYFSSASSALFDIDVGSTGKLKLINFHPRRARVSHFSGAMLFTHIASSPNYYIDMTNATLEEWRNYQLSDVKSNQITLKNTYFDYFTAASGAARTIEFIDQIRRTAAALPAVTDPNIGYAYSGMIVSLEGASAVADGLYICRKKADNTYEWKLIV